MQGDYARRLWETIVLGELFDPNAEFSIAEHFRPHWSQAGAVVFITFRTADSIPKEVLRRWEREKNEWFRRLGFAIDQRWSAILETVDESTRRAFQMQFNRTREAFLDTCHGQCLLRHPEIAKIVADALLHFDGERYRMGDFVVMPNHVHLLASFASEVSLAKQSDSWLRFTATKINRAIGAKGKFWQQEPFDHLVRSISQYEYLRRYIADNPTKAGLQPGEYFYYRK